MPAGSADCASQDCAAAQGVLATWAPLTESPPDTDPELVGKPFGPYRIVLLLVHGGMGRARYG